MKQQTETLSLSDYYFKQREIAIVSYKEKLEFFVPNLKSALSKLQKGPFIILKCLTNFEKYERIPDTIDFVLSINNPRKVLTETIIFSHKSKLINKTMYEYECIQYNTGFNTTFNDDILKDILFNTAKLAIDQHIQRNKENIDKL